MTRLSPALALASALFSTNALAATCDVLTAKDDSDARVIDVRSTGGECSVKFGALTITSTVDEDRDTCAVVDGGDNIIVIWPANAEGGYCTYVEDGGQLDVLIWPT